MDDAEGMGVRECRGHLQRELPRRAGVEPADPPEPVAERAGLDVRHGVEEPARGASRIEQRQDVRVLEAGLRADLSLEALDAEGRAEGRVEHLERHPAAVPEVLGQVDRRAAAPAELVLHQVVIGKLRREEVLAIWRGSRI
jgi:hypothetical protein